MPKSTKTKQDIHKLVKKDDQETPQLMEVLPVMGCPTKFRKEYTQKILDFFLIEPLVEREVVYTNKKGETWSKWETTHNRLPTFERFAALLSVDTETLRRWATAETKSGRVKNKDFCGAYAKCKQLQKNFLMECGTYGLFNPSFTKFVAINITDMKDKQEVDHTSDGERIEGITYLPPAKS